MSDWTWEYVPDAANVVGGLTQAQIDQVESLASRIADAVAVRRIGTPFDVTEAVSNVKSYGEGPVMIWFIEDYRDDVVLVVRVQHFELPDPTGLRHRHGRCVTQTTTQNWSHPCALLGVACSPRRLGGFGGPFVTRELVGVITARMVGTMPGDFPLGRVRRVRGSAGGVLLGRLAEREVAEAAGSRLRERGWRGSGGSAGGE